MRKLFPVLIVLILLQSCNKESYYTLIPSENIAGFIPDNKSPKRYVSNNGDTLTFEQQGIDTNTVKTNDDIGPTGTVGTLDYVEVQEHSATIQSLNAPFKVQYHLTSIYDEQLGSRSRDFLEVSYSEGEEILAQIDFLHTDTLSCISPRCDFLSSLKLQEKTFNNVYFLKRDSLNRVSIYLNQNKGLVGFRTADNRIFELID